MNKQASIGYAPGGWDHFHAGHLAFLKRARRMVDLLVVGVVSDEALEQAKGRPPMFPLAERMEVIRALDLADWVVEDTTQDKRNVWYRVRFDRIIKGDDWKDTQKGRELESQMAELGVTVHYLPYSVRKSSTQLRMTAVIEEYTPWRQVMARSRFRVLVVCEANQCRSPMIAAALRERIGAADLPWDVVSAGLGALAGTVTHRQAIQALHDGGIAASASETVQLTSEMISEADLILTATDSQRIEVVRALPRKASVAFTLKHFAHLVAGSPADANATQGGVLKRAAQGRMLVQPMRGSRDLADPVSGGPAAFAACLVEILAAVECIIPATPIVKGA